MSSAVTNARIKELALGGLSHFEIADELRWLRPETVRVYFSRIVGKLTPSERAVMQQARAGRTRVRRDGYHKKFAERKALSAEHIRIGRKLCAHRLEQELNLGEMAQQYQLSNRVTLSSMEQGYHDFTFSEIRRIAEILGTTIEDLMCPPPGALAA